MNKENLREKLQELTLKIKDAVSDRTLFLDENMKHFAEFQIGDKVYNCKNGQIGICTEHYRYHQCNYEYDNSLSTNCKIKEPIGVNFIDNTSRFAGGHPWVKLEDYENKTEKYYHKLEMLARFS